MSAPELRAVAVPSVAEGEDIGKEPSAYLIIVFKGSAQIFRTLIPNPDYVKPPPPTPLELADQALSEARAALRYAQDEENDAWWEFVRLSREAK